MMSSNFEAIEKAQGNKNENILIVLQYVKGKVYLYGSKNHKHNSRLPRQLSIALEELKKQFSEI